MQTSGRSYRCHYTPLDRDGFPVHSESGDRQITDHAANVLLAPLPFPRTSIAGLEVTELPPAEGALQWRLAVALQGHNPALDFENTRPMWEAA